MGGGVGMERGGDMVFVCTWVGMANTKGLQGIKYYPSLNPTQGAGSINVFLICNPLFLNNNNNDICCEFQLYGCSLKFTLCNFLLYVYSKAHIYIILHSIIHLQ